MGMAEGDAAEATIVIEFRRFQVSPRGRTLLADGAPVDIGSRAFDLLLLLLEARGAVVGKEEILSRVWPDTTVEENSLQVQISALRRLLGPDRDVIATVSGRGYQFVGEVRASAIDTPAARPAAPPTKFHPGNLPALISELIGREAEFDEAAGFVAGHRFVTLTGAGGIGKTRLGIELARRLLPDLPDGVWLAQLGPLTDPALVPLTLAAAMGLEIVGGTVSAGRVAAALTGKRLLVILDNCEHLLEAAAGLAEALLHAGPELRVLATSREPLGAEGEQLYRVPPLAVPPEEAASAAEALQHGAAQLFVTRALAADPRFQLTDQSAAALGTILRRLDGIPLALELAAARAGALGIDGIAARLDDRFSLLTGGRRTALPRHQTLKATLDWSYGMLGEPERILLRRLVVFAGGFTLDAAVAVTSDGGLDAALDTPGAVAGIGELVAKSLLVASLGGDAARYRLLETTRAYAANRLDESGERPALARRHADYYRALLEGVEPNGVKPKGLETKGLDSKDRAPPAGRWRSTYGPELDNIRAALDWALGPAGDAATGVALTAAAASIWIQLSLASECSSRVTQALGRLNAVGGRGTRLEMQLQTALGAALVNTRGSVAATVAARSRALQLAEALGDEEYQLRVLYGFWIDQLRLCQTPASLATAERFQRVARGAADPGDVAVGDRMIGVALHYAGDQTGARMHIERMLAQQPAEAGYRAQTLRFGNDQRAGALTHLARVLWLQGHADQAMATLEAAAEAAEASDHVISGCYMLADGACPISVWIGDLDAAGQYTDRLIAHGERHDWVYWPAYGRAVRALILARRVDVAAGAAQLRAAIAAIRAAGSEMHCTMLRGWLAEVLLGAGRRAEARAAVEEGLERARSAEEGWYLPELLRIRGELLLRDGEAAAGAAHLHEALSLARRQGALAWELRGALSLARHWRRGGEVTQGGELLAGVHARFTEGFATADLRAAEALLAELG